MTWLWVLAWVAAGLALLRYLGILQAVGGAFAAWLQWIGAR